MSARSELAALLTKHLPADVVIVDYARAIDGPPGPTVMPRLDAVRRSQAASGFRDYSIALILLVPQTTPGPADVQLEALLEDVWFALEKLTAGTAGITFEEARRAVYNDTTPAFEIPLTVTVTAE